MKLLAIPLLAALAMPHCQSVPPAPPPANVATAPKLEAASTDRLSQISAHAEAAEVAAQKIPDMLIRRSVQGPLSVVRSLAGPAKDADRAAALALVVEAQAGKLDQAETGWAKARADAGALVARVADLEATVTRERAAAAVELSRQLQDARDQARRESEARERVIKTWLFFGLGTLLILAAVASFFLRAYLPFLGPQVSLWLGIGGAALILTGIIVRSVERLIEDHPFIFWGGLLGAICAVVGAAALMLANHHHAKLTPADVS
jgi:hypothetical protein